MRRRFSVAPAARLLPPPVPATPACHETLVAAALATREDAGERDAGKALVPLTPVDGLRLAIAAVPGGGKVDVALLAAFAEAAAPNTLRALIGDLRTFTAWCRRVSLVALPASPATIVAFLAARSAAGAAPASLSRCKASLARVHSLCGLVDPTRDPLVTLKLRAIRRERGTVQRQARPLRFHGAVADVRDGSAAPRGLALSALLAACPDTPIGARDRAILSVAYDTGLRAAEIVALAWADLLPAIDPDAGLILVRRAKGDQEGQGATAYLSPRSMRALDRWREAATIDDGALFRRVFVRRLPPRAAVPGERWARIENGVLRHGKLPDRPALPARTHYSVGAAALGSGVLTAIYRTAARRAFAAGLLPDLTAEDFARWVAGISAHSTRVGLTQDLFSAGEDLAGIMDALRWQSPRMPLLYNRNLMAESGAARRVVGKL